MAVERASDQAARFSGVTRLRAGSIPIPDNSRLSAAVGRMRDRAAAREQEEAQEAAVTQGLRDQSDLGTASERAIPPERLSGKSEDAYRRATAAVAEQQRKTELARARAEFVRKYPDPEDFAGAWDNFMDGRLRVLEQTNPDAAVREQLAMDAVGSETLIKLEEAKYARERKMQSAEYLNGVEEEIVAYEDTLLNTGDEEVFFEARETLEARARDGIADNLVDPEKGLAWVESRNDSLATQFSRGSFNTSLNEGDAAGARGIIRQLRQGKRFNDNEKALRLADELERDFVDWQESNAAPGADPAATLRQLGKAEDAMARAGDTLSQSELEETLTTSVNMYQRVAPLLTPTQNLRAQEHIAGMSVVADVNRVAPNMTVSELEALRADATRRQLPQNQQPGSSLSTGTFGKIEDLAESHIARIETAIDTGDYVSAQPELPLNASAEEVMRRRRRAARQTGVPVSEVVPRSRKEMERFGAEYNAAMQNADYARANEVLSNALRGTENPWDAQALAQRSSDISQQMSAGMVLRAAGVDAEAEDMLRFAGIGGQTDPEDTGIDTATFDVLMNRGETADIVDGLAMGDPAQFSGARELVRDVMVGVAAQKRATGEAADVSEIRAEVNRIFAPMIDSVSLENGTRVPRVYLSGHPEGAQVVEDEINRHFENPELLGVDPDDEFALRTIVPRPLGGDSIGFYNTGTGGWVPDPENEGEPYRLFPGQLLEQHQQTEPATLFERAEASARDLRRNFETNIRALSLGRAARSVGASEAGGLAEDLAFAGFGTPAGQTDTSRLPGFAAMPVDALDVVDEQAIRKAAIEDVKERGGRGGQTTREQLQAIQEGPLNGPALEDYTLAAYSKHLQDKYADEEQAVAAYWVGEDVLDSLLDRHGNDWRAELPADAEKFLQRAEQRRSLPEQAVDAAVRTVLPGMAEVRAIGGFLAEELGREREVQTAGERRGGR